VESSRRHWAGRVLYSDSYVSQHGAANGRVLPTTNGGGSLVQVHAGPYGCEPRDRPKEQIAPPPFPAASGWESVLAKRSGSGATSKFRLKKTHHLGPRTTARTPHIDTTNNHRAPRVVVADAVLALQGAAEKIITTTSRCTYVLYLARILF
jgi:hypothetical protein